MTERREVAVTDLNKQVTYITAEAIREELHQRLTGPWVPLIRDEMPICLGSSRADVVGIGDYIVGYEIKGGRDTLKRLSQQIFHYDKVMDYACVVCTSKHAQGALNLVPKHWAVIEAFAGDALDFIVRQQPSLNPNVEALALAKLLWSHEASSVLTAHGIECKAMGAWKKWDALVENLPFPVLHKEVREVLLNRLPWPAKVAMDDPHRRKLLVTRSDRPIFSEVSA